MTRLLLGRLLPALAALVIFWEQPADALDPARTIHQYKHTRWTRAEGAPAPIYHIAQTPDGYLWLATGDGLFRFDGLGFERVDANLSPKAGSARALLVAKNGDLWVSYRSGVFAIYRQGRLRVVPSPGYEGEVIALAQAANGDIWAAIGQLGRPMLRYRNGKWDQLLPTNGYGRDSFTSFAVTADGALWISYVNQVLRQGPNSSGFQRLLYRPGTRPTLSLDREGRVWSRDDTGIRPLTGPGGRWSGGRAPFTYPTTKVRRGFRPLFDKDGNFWVARRADGIERLRSPSPSGPKGAVEPSLEYLARDGLTSDTTYAIFEDREGNIWVATSLGLDRFRNAPIAIEPNLTQPAAYGDILFSAADGAVYVAQADSIFRVRPAGRPELLEPKTGEPEAICEGPDRSIWIVLANRILSVRGDKKEWVERPKNTESGIYACGVDRWGRMWMTAAGSGLFKKAGATWKNSPAVLAQFKFYPMNLVKDFRGDTWLNWGLDTLAKLKERGQDLHPIPPSLGGIRTMVPTRAGLLLSGDKGIGRLSEGQLSVLKIDHAPFLKDVNGITETSRGETWAVGPSGIIRLASADLNRAFSDANFHPAARVFDFADGLPDRFPSQSQNSLVQGGDGRLWAATLAGTVWIDPKRIARNPVPPAVVIGSLVAAGKRYLDPRTIELSPGNSSIVIGFAALGLGVPERVAVRYRLEGQDERWIDPGVRRQAFYTNLGPGSYRFRVIAANEDGIWNKEGATLEFSIAPTFVQSAWFKLLLAVAVAGLLAILYWLRLRQVTARMQNRFDVRIAERERIARELHDTLLQGFQGLMLQFKAGVNRLPEASMRKPLDEALARAQAVLIEGRDRVRDLRMQQGPTDLGEALLACASDLAGNQGIRVQFTSEGAPQALHPLVREEMERIFEEAVRNIVTHAKATSLDVLLIWGRRALSLSVRDNGRGMPQAVRDEGGRPGHFGLVGMRERAERIGGALGISSRPEGGTEISVILPAAAAYCHHPIGLFDGLRAVFPSFTRRHAE